MIVTRFPPSPTGYLHIGSARTALYSWLHARQHDGTFVLRIEDTDRERSSDESVQAILDGMQWLGLDYDQGPFFQTQRFARYREVIQQLLASNHAYHCQCSRQRLDQMREQQKAEGRKPKYDGRCRELNLDESESTVVRFKNPLQGDVLIRDMVKGDIVVSNLELDDLVIARADGVPTYNLTVVGAVSVMQYRDQGFLPEALLNYLVRLGWSHGDQELFSMQELMSLFRIEDVSRSASTFNPDKLMWVNQETIRALSPAELLDKSRWHFEQAGIDVPVEQRSSEIIGLVQERCKTLVDVVAQSRFFFTSVHGYDETAVAKHIRPGSVDLLSELTARLDNLKAWQAEDIHAVLQQVVQQHEVGFAKVAQPVRIAVTGNTISPAIDQTLQLLGKDICLRRLNRAISVFEQSVAPQGTN